MNNPTNSLILTNSLIEESLTSDWDYGNNVLYNLCKKDFYHVDNGKILAKVWLIGRAYSASIDRQRTNSSQVSSDKYYIECVLPKFKNPKIDEDLEYLKGKDIFAIMGDALVDNDTIQRTLKLHKDLMDILKEKGEKDRRSFCSKYLHFHLRELFFIYDYRAATAINSFQKKLKKNEFEIEFEKLGDKTDREYTRFYLNCFKLKKTIESEYSSILPGQKLTIRQLDNLLTKYADKKYEDRAKLKLKDVK